MSSEPQVRNWWPLGIVSALVVVGIANAIMVTFALVRPSVAVSEDPYADALDYDRVIAEREASAALHWGVTTEVCADGLAPTGCVVALTVLDRNGRAVEGLGGWVDARRGDDARLDRVADVVDLGDGHYAATLALAQSGFYEFSVRLEGAASPWIARFTEPVRGRAS